MLGVCMRRSYAMTAAAAADYTVVMQATNFGPNGPSRLCAVSVCVCLFDQMSKCARKFRIWFSLGSFSRYCIRASHTSYYSIPVNKWKEEKSCALEANAPHIKTNTLDFIELIPFWVEVKTFLFNFLIFFSFNFASNQFQSFRLAICAVKNRFVVQLFFLFNWIDGRFARVLLGRDENASKLETK